MKIVCNVSGCFGSIFLLYLDDSVINELLEMGLMDNNLLPIHEKDTLRRRLCDKDWNERVKRFKQKYYAHKKQCNLENAMTNEL